MPRERAWSLAVLPTAALAVIALLVSAGGCRRVAGYGAADPDTWHRGDLDVGVPVDVSKPLDSLSGRDATVVPREDGGSKDAGSAVDGPTTTPPDLGPLAVDQTFLGEAGGCIEKHPVTAGAACQAQQANCTLGQPPDRDCDGLPDLFDPAPGLCNPLLAQHECDADFGIGASDGCTVLIEKGFTYVGISSARVDKTLWHARFRSDGLLPAGSKVGFSGQQGAAYRSCILLDGGTDVVMQLTADPVTSAPGSATNSRPKLPAGDYMLTISAKGPVHACTLYDADGKLLLTASTALGPTMSGNFTVQASAPGAARIWLDYVRIFEDL